MRYLITGAAGFIGSHFVDYVLSNTNSEVCAFDDLTYAGNFNNLISWAKDARFHFVRGNICDPDEVDAAMQNIDLVVHFAAESHVDRSITNVHPFVMTNVVGTQVLLDAALKRGVDLFVQVSTDEVYGSLGKTGQFTESTPLNPTNAYAASKASADLMAMSYQKTHGLRVIVTRSGNNYGPRQFPEKIVPLFITDLMQNKQVPLYGNGLNVRDWIYVTDHCSAIQTVIDKGAVGEVYNIGANCELSNLELTKRILAAMGKNERCINYVRDRLGHDFRYATDSTKLRKLGWRPQVDMQTGLQMTIDWYANNSSWLNSIVDGTYRDAYDDWYMSSI